MTYSIPTLRTLFFVLRISTLIGIKSKFLKSTTKTKISLFFIILSTIDRCFDKKQLHEFFFRKIIFAKVICSWIFIQGFILISIAWERFNGFPCDLRQNGDLISRYNMTQSDFAKKKFYYKKKLLFINNWIIF